MKTKLLSLFACSFLLTQAVNLDAQQRKDYFSDASYIVGTYKPKASDHSVKTMVAKAEALIKLLDAQQNKKLMGPVDGEIRREWTNLPARPDADGIRLGELNDDQVKAACDLMASLLSEQGYKKMVEIMLADDQLLPRGRRRPGFGTEDFSIVIFGKPSESSPWGFQLDGHHIGVNLSIEGDKLTMSPSFIGTQPESFKIGGQSFRPFAGEMDVAYELVGSLNFEQLKTGILSDSRGNIRLGPGQDGRVPRKAGVSCKTFNDDQKKLLMKLIGQWVNCMPVRIAKPRLAQLEKEIDQMTFGWNGDKKPKSDVSYIIQGPSLIIEYACQDLGGDPLNHLHSVYRNPKNEYGGQLK